MHGLMNVKLMLSTWKACGQKETLEFTKQKNAYLRLSSVLSQRSTDVPKT